jgi:hypothetical protein
MGGAVCSAVFPAADPNNYPCEYFDASGAWDDAGIAKYPRAATYEILTIKANFAVPE